MHAAQIKVITTGHRARKDDYHSACLWELYQVCELRISSVLHALAVLLQQRDRQDLP